MSSACRSLLSIAAMAAVFVMAGGCQTRTIHVGGDQVAMVGEQLGTLGRGEAGRVLVQLAKPRALDLRVHFAQAPFSGTRLDVKVNGHRLPPYFAFGGDTRYDHVRGVAGMRPPVAEIEGRWLIPPHLLQAGANVIELSSDGTRSSDVLEEIGPRPRIVIDRLTLRPADGGDLPEYANSIYYDFALWPQGYDWGRGGTRRFHYDNALLGIVNGKGMPNVIPGLGSDANAWEAKRQAEQLWQDWGFRNFEFYTIWSFCSEPDAWARFVDVDNDPDTEGSFHSQTIFPHVRQAHEAARGADVMLYDIEKWTAALEPAIRQLAPYATYYNFKCEQHGPWGQGFGDDGQRYAEHGYDGLTWARNYYQAMRAARDLVQKYDAEEGFVQEQNHWLPSIRTVLFDTARERGEPMGDMIDVLTTHFGTVASYDLDENNRAVPGETMHLQYPGGRAYESGWRDRWIGHVSEGGIRWVKDSSYPENALDFNRYRLGRTEADMTLADPAVHRWGNGRPFDYRAGFRGDERMYNSEHGIWQGYGAATPYDFLHGMFAYSLMPTGETEPRDLSIRTRESLTKTHDLNVNLYGRWVDGAGHTKRLRTIDPLYGDMFGWTGNEHCNAGDYITMVGIKDHHHRQQGADAFGLVRRMCYAFVTTGTIYPSWLGERHSDDLFVKTLVQTIEGRPYVCVYAANFADQSQTLDIVLPLSTEHGAAMLVFDEKAWDWAVHERQPLASGDTQRISREVAGHGALMVAIPVAPDALARALDLPTPPEMVEPGADVHVQAAAPSFQLDPLTVGRAQIEVAREARFRPVDRVAISPVFTTSNWTMDDAPQAGQRLWWRVRRVDDAGRPGPWSAPRPFVYQWPEYAAKYGPQAPAGEKAWREDPQWDWLEQRDPIEAPNLAWEGEIVAAGGHMNAGSRASDGQIDTHWSNETNVNRSEFETPAYWAIIWPQARTFSTIELLWDSDRMPVAYAVEISSDGQTWRELARVNAGLAV